MNALAPRDFAFLSTFVLIGVVLGTIVGLYWITFFIFLAIGLISWPFDSIGDWLLDRPLNWIFDHFFGTADDVTVAPPSKVAVSRLALIVGFCIGLFIQAKLGRLDTLIILFGGSPWT